MLTVLAMWEDVLVGSCYGLPIVNGLYDEDISAITPNINDFKRDDRYCHLFYGRLHLALSTSTAPQYHLPIQPI